jgi:hypothetical protein
MSAAETATALGQERLAACAFRVPINGKLEPMCAVNTMGLREQVYQQPARPLIAPLGAPYLIAA